jgi:hypothetical protein
MPFNPIASLRVLLSDLKIDYPNEIDLNTLQLRITERLGVINTEKIKTYVDILCQLGYLERVSPVVFKIKV